MAFKPRQDVYHDQTRLALLDNTLTVKVGDVIIPKGGTGTAVYTNATASLYSTAFVLGVVLGFAGPQGQVIGNGQDPSNTPNQLTTASNNTTVAKYQAVYLPIYSDSQEFSATLSASAATTTGSDQPHVYFTLTDARTVNEASVVASDDATAPLQILSLGLDPSDSTNHTIICKFAKALLTRP